MSVHEDLAIGILIGVGLSIWVARLVSIARSGRARERR